MGAKILLLCCVLSILHLTRGLPTKAARPYKPEHCVRLTSENEAKINEIIVSLSDFLYDLSAKHENLDIRLVKIDIEGHSDDEVEEKETEVQVVVNDCGLAEDEPVVQDGEVVEIEYTDNKNGAKNNASENNSQSTTVNNSKTVNKNSKTVNNNSKTVKTVNSESSEITNNASVNNDNKSTVIQQSNDKNSEPKNVAPIKPQPTTPTEENYKERPINKCNNQNYRSSKPVIAKLNLDEEGQKLLKKIEKKKGKSSPLLFYVQKDSMVFLN